MRFIHQRFDNDCSIACAAMATGIYYGTLLDAAIAEGFKPDTGIGTSVGDVFDRHGYQWRYVENTYALETCELGVVIIELENGEGWHAVVVADGVLYDPNRQTPVDLGYAAFNGVGMVIDIKKAR